MADETPCADGVPCAESGKEERTVEGNDRSTLDGCCTLLTSLNEANCANWLHSELSGPGEDALKRLDRGDHTVSPGLSGMTCLPNSGDARDTEVVGASNLPLDRNA